MRVGDRRFFIGGERDENVRPCIELQTAFMNCVWRAKIGSLFSAQ
jgi:hypothetical protein